MTDEDFRLNVCTALAEIVMHLRELTAIQESGEGDESECLHPEELRIDFSTPGEDHWQCSECGHEHYVKRS